MGETRTHNSKSERKLLSDLTYYVKQGKKKRKV